MDSWCTVSLYSYFFSRIWPMQKIWSVVDLLFRNPHLWSQIISTIWIHLGIWFQFPDSYNIRNMMQEIKLSRYSLYILIGWLSGETWNYVKFPTLSWVVPFHNIGRTSTCKGRYDKKENNSHSFLTRTHFSCLNLFHYALSWGPISIPYVISLS
jgi:hypothetical protein